LASGERQLVRSEASWVLCSLMKFSIWPCAQGRASLRQEIHRVLDALSRTGTNVLIVTRDQLAVRPGAILTDVQEVAQASPQTPEALRPFDAELLEDLEGVDPRFDAWLQAERRQLRSRALRIAESILREVNDLDEAVEAAERGPSRDLGDHAALAKAGPASAIRSNRCPNPAPSVPL
jgi:hypothetical protein